MCVCTYTTKNNNRCLYYVLMVCVHTSTYGLLASIADIQATIACLPATLAYKPQYLACQQR